MSGLEARPAGPVTNFCWQGAQSTAEATVAQVCRDGGSLAAVRGQFAIRAQDGGEHWLLRDALGVNKLFFALDGDTVRTSNYLIDLIRDGFELRNVWSVPSGHVVKLVPGAREYSLTRVMEPGYSDQAPGDVDLQEHAERIRLELERTFVALAGVAAGRRTYVTLSGGLDSSTIAVLARQHLGRFTAVTFSVAGHDGELIESEDLQFARRIARDIDVPLRVVSATPDEILAMLDEVLVYGQDWRDFNVHCGLVNAAIAGALGREAREQAHAPRPLVLTGDAMNEIMSDYTAVTYAGREYYSLPRLSRARLRRFLVEGLDSGDREVGIYARHGLDLIQPYALCAFAYLALPGGFLDTPGPKERLVEAIMGERVPRYIRQRPKVRAQAGGTAEMRGTLAILADAGVDSQQLRARFAALLGAPAAEVERLIRGGYYRFATHFPAGNMPS